MKVMIPIFPFLLSLILNQEAIVCEYPPGYIQCMIFHSKNLKTDERGHVLEGNLGNSYTFGIDVNEGEHNRYTLILNKSTNVSFFPDNGNWEKGHIKNCTLSQTTGVPVWGSVLLLTLPRGSFIEFTSLGVPDGGDWKRQVRVDNAILGSDADIPGFGILKKGTHLYFRFLGSDPNNGRISLNSEY